MVELTMERSDAILTLKIYMILMLWELSILCLSKAHGNKKGFQVPKNTCSELQMLHPSLTNLSYALII